MESGSDGCGDAKRLWERCGGPADLRHHAAYLLCYHPDQPAHNPGHHLQPPASQLAELLLPEPAGGRYVHGVALPFIPWMGLNRPLSFSSCLLVHIFPNFLFLAFLFNLVLVHYERYRSIVSPLQRGRLWLHRRFKLPLLAVWMLPLLFALLPAFGWNNKAGHDRNECCPIINSTARSECVALWRALLYIPQCLSKRFHLFGSIWFTGTCHPLHCCHDVPRVVDHTRAAEGHPASAASRSKQGLQTENGNALCFFCVAAISLAFLTCWVPYIVYTHIGMEFLIRRGGKSNRTGHIVLSCVGIGGIAVVPLLLGLANREYTDPVKKLFRKLRHR